MAEDRGKEVGELKSKRWEEEVVAVGQAEELVVAAALVPVQSATIPEMTI